jgi:Fe-S-cluster containining protein
VLKAFIELRNLHTLFDAAQGVLEIDLGTPVCFPKCGLCCTHRLPDCMVIEGALMVSMLTGEGALSRVTQIAEDWLLQKTPEATIYRGLPVGFVPPDIKAEWEALSATRCPFLDEETKKCAIYSSRPLVCRAYGTTRDIQYCPRPLGKGEHSTRRGVIDSTEIRKVVQGFKDHCSRYPEWTIRGFAPAILYRAAFPDKFHGLVDDNRIASAKVIGTEMDFALMWQPDVDAMRQGHSKDAIEYKAHKLIAGRN